MLTISIMCYPAAGNKFSLFPPEGKENQVWTSEYD